VRLERAEKEITYADKFDLLVTNDKIEAAYSEINEAVRKFISNQ
jgi:guanylate kinase